MIRSVRLVSVCRPKSLLVAMFPVLGLSIALTILSHSLLAEHLKEEAYPLSQDANDTSCDSRFTMKVYAGDYRYFLGKPEAVNLTVPFGTPVLVECFKMIVLKGNNEIIFEDKNITDVLVTQNYLDKTKYTCRFKENCESSALVTVTPVINVTSLFMISECVDNFNGQCKHIVQYGHPLEVTCSGPSATQLILTKDREEIYTEIVNNNTRKLIVNEPGLQISEYVCIDNLTNANCSTVITVETQMYIQLENRTISPEYRRDGLDVYRVAYDDPLEIICAGPRAVTLVNLDDDKVDILSENVNRTTANITIFQRGNSVLGCVDSNKLSENTSELITISKLAYTRKIRILLTPRIEITSPNMHNEGKDPAGLNKFVVKHGDILGVICSGIHATIQLSKEEYDIYELYKLNHTTNKWTTYINEPKNFGYKEYVCSMEDTHSAVLVRVDVHPKADEFHCISYDLQYLKCAWTSPSPNNITYTLFHEHELLYNETNSDQSRTFVWNYNHSRYRSNITKFSFLMQSCNVFGCFKEYHEVDHCAVVKLSPPQGLVATNITLHSAVLRWDHTSIHCGDKRMQSPTDFQYNVTYRYSGKYKKVDLPSVSCSIVCEVDLKLLRSDQFYYVSVSHKLRDNGDEFWSDPGLVEFSTDFEFETINQIYGNGNTGNLPSDIETSNTQTTWIVLIILGVISCLIFLAVVLEKQGIKILTLFKQK